MQTGAFVFVGTLAFLVVAIVVFVIWRIIRSSQMNSPSEEETITYRGTGALQRISMNVAEFASLCLVIGSTIVAAMVGRTYGRIAAMASDPRNADDFVTAGTLIGGISGFFSAAILMAFVFTISAIEKNTRHTAMMFEKLGNRR